jgi:hypothetical protein
MGCRFILLTVSKKGPISNSGLSKRRLFNSIQLISISWFSVDSNSGFWFFNLIVSNLKSTNNLTTIDLFQDSDLNFQMIQPDFWSLIYSILDSSKSVSGSSNLEFLITDLRFSNWFNQRFPVQNFQIPDSRFLFLDEIQIPVFYFKSRLNVNLIWKNQSHFSRWARLILRIQIIRLLPD